MFILFVFVFFVQVPCTTISLTWRIIGTMSLIIVITNAVFLIFKRYRCFILFYFYIRYTILFWSFTWVVYFLNTSFSFYRISWSFFPLFLLGIRCLSVFTIDKLFPCPDIPERLELSFLISLSLGFSILVLLSDKLADKIDLYLFTDFTVSSISVLWVYLDSSNDLPLSDVFFMDLSFFF